MLRLKAIREFINQYVHPDLASLYTDEMEVQVNVAQEDAEIVMREYMGHKYKSFDWPDGQHGGPIRIPRGAKTKPEYTDSEITFDLAAHVEGIGMTGWNWKQKKSIWVAYDFDAITGHSDQHQKKLTEQELQEIKTKLASIPYVTVRHSTGGSGLHVYVHLEPVTTETHTEHAAVARAVLGLLASEAGISLTSKVDVCGGNMWIWHRKMKGDGLRAISQFNKLLQVPQNWREHINVIKGKSSRAVPSFIDEKQKEAFDQLCGQRPIAALDDDHKKLIAYLQDNKHSWYWDADYNMLVTHTAALKAAHKDMQLKGIFDTMAEGTEQYDINCYCFPTRDGSWTVRRFTKGVAESPSWTQDGTGWTKCTLNADPTFDTVSKTYGAQEHPKGGYVFNSMKNAQFALQVLGIELVIPDIAAERDVLVKEKDGKLIVSMPVSNRDAGIGFSGWLTEKNTLFKVVSPNTPAAVEHDEKNFDSVIRHTVSEDGVGLDWHINVNSRWNTEPITHVREALSYLGLSTVEVKDALGSSIFKPWTDVNIPFGVEYPGDRKWNRDAAKFSVVPALDEEYLSFPTWQKLLRHLGTGLDDAVASSIWCQRNGVQNGGEYLTLWIASMFQFPNEPLPYLFLFSKEQNTGKTTFHEALQSLMTKGCVRADKALRSKGDFNGELIGCVLCAIDEININEAAGAYDRIKDWVTSRQLLIHPKGQTPYMIKNTSHWIQTANKYEYCPVFPGDTRIVAIKVPAINPEDRLPGTCFFNYLLNESSHFLAHCLKLEVPQSDDRLRLPVLVTKEKMVIEAYNKNPIDQFIDTRMTKVEGYAVNASKIYEAYRVWCHERELPEVSCIAFGKKLIEYHDKGRAPHNAKTYYINCVLKPDDPFFTLPEPTATIHTNGDMILANKEAHYVE